MLRNLVGVVTGGASGLGKATAKLLAEEGCKITIFDVPESAGKQVENSLQKIMLDVNFVPGSICSEADTDRLFSNVIERNKKLDFVINCAGISFAQKVFNLGSGRLMNLKTLDYVIQTNIVGAINVVTRGSRAIALNVPDEDGLRGVIVTTMGLEAIDGQVGQVPGSICGGALASSLLPMSRDLSNAGIRINGICVGVLESPLTEGLPEAMQNYIKSSCMAPKRYGKAEEFAHAVKFIIENKYLNAFLLRLDGGMRMNMC